MKELERDNFLPKNVVDQRFAAVVSDRRVFLHVDVVKGTSGSSA